MERLRTDGRKPGSCLLPGCGMGGFGEQRFCCIYVPVLVLWHLMGFFISFLLVSVAGLCSIPFCSIPGSTGSSLGKQGPEISLPFSLPNFKPRLREAGRRHCPLRFCQAEDTSACSQEKRHYSVCASLSQSTAHSLPADRGPLSPSSAPQRRFRWVLALLSHMQLHQAVCQLLFHLWLSGPKKNPQDAARSTG